MTLEQIKAIYNKPLTELISLALQTTKKHFNSDVELCSLKSIKWNLPRRLQILPSKWTL